MIVQAEQDYKERRFNLARDRCLQLVNNPYIPVIALSNECMSLLNEKYFVSIACWQILSRLTGHYRTLRRCHLNALQHCDQLQLVSDYGLADVREQLVSHARLSNIPLIMQLTLIPDRRAAGHGRVATEALSTAGRPLPSGRN